MVANILRAFKCVRTGASKYYSRGGDGAEALLPRGVPDLKLHLLPVDLNRPDLKIHPDCGDVATYKHVL